MKHSLIIFLILFCNISLFSQTEECKSYCFYYSEQHLNYKKKLESHPPFESKRNYVNNKLYTFTVTSDDYYYIKEYKRVWPDAKLLLCSCLKDVDIKVIKKQ